MSTLVVRKLDRSAGACYDGCVLRKAVKGSSMNILEEAIIFAVKAHAGAVRKDGRTPYILHPLEAMQICASLTDDPEVLAAAVLHDTVEDTSVTPEELRSLFGERVAALVASETENKRVGLPPESTWQIRKEESLQDLENAEDPAIRILWLADKLSNMRSFYKLWQAEGDAVWEHFHQKDPLKQAWYYRRIAEALSGLSGTGAWKEYDQYVRTIFGEVEV